MNIKKIVLMMLLSLSVVVMFGCNTNKQEVASNEGEKKISIVTTTFAPYDFARQVVGDKGEVTMLVPPATEIHSFEPSPQDIIKLQNCDLFIYCGGESDEWVSDVLASIGNDKIKVIKMMDCVDVVEEELVEGMEEEHEHGHDHEHEGDATEHEELEDEEVHEGNESKDHEAAEETGEAEHENEEVEFDEHVWTSPSNAIAITKEIERVLSEMDETNSSKYEEQAAAYITKLEEIDEQFKKVVAEGNRKEVIFADRFPLRYFVDAYGLSYYAAFPGCSTDTEPSAATVAFLIDKVKEDQIPVVFHIEMSNEKMADTICEATGAKKLLFNACHTVSKEDFESGVTYADIMEQNIETLKEALK